MNEPTKDDLRAYIEKNLPGAIDAGPKEWVFRPTKDAPVRFKGILLARAGEPNPKEYITRTRWFTLSIYAANSGLFVLTIEYRSYARPMDEFLRLFVEKDAEGIRRRINEYDHMAWIQGFPPEPQFATKQDRLVHQLGAQFRAAATEALTQAAKVNGQFERWI